MSRDTPQALEETLDGNAAQGEDRELLLARLSAVERAYQELLERVRRYERERADIRARVQRVLARLG